MKLTNIFSEKSKVVFTLYKKKVVVSQPNFHCKSTASNLILNIRSQYYISMPENNLFKLCKKTIYFCLCILSFNCFSSNTFYEVSAGSEHTCGIDNFGVTCWGNNTYGQLDIPESISNPSRLTSYFTHSCVIDDSGLQCWGANYNGQLNVPVLTNPSEVSAGFSHTCAIDEVGAHCWGGNGHGQLNVPSTGNQLSNLAAGASHTCVVGRYGLYCWGANYGGQLNGPNHERYSKVTAGDGHTCGIKENKLLCWGNNLYGETNVPENLINPSIVSAGFTHTCAIDEVGLHCWGNNSHGQLDIPNSLLNPTNVDAGRAHTCAIDDIGLQCWGDNSLGQLDIPLRSLDIDGNERYDALTDGLLILRSMFGLDGSSFTAGTTVSDAVYDDSEELSSRIISLGDLIDIDGSGKTDALTDGLLILRYLFGLEGETLVADSVSADSIRTTEEIEAHLEMLMPEF